MKPVLRGGGADVFHHLVDATIRRNGGPGSLGQVILRCQPDPDPVAIARGLARLAADARPLGARCRWSWRGVRWQLLGPAPLSVESGPDLEALAGEHLHRPLAEGCGLRLGLGPGGVVLTWDHRLLDARGAIGLLTALPGLAAGGRLGECWWAADYRELPELPAPTAHRGRLARNLLPLLRPTRLATLWRPRHGGAAAPLVIHDLRLDAGETALLDSRIRQVAGRFGETAFLLAALAGALESLGGARGDFLFPLAVDARPAGDPRRLANCHGFTMLLLAAGRATTDFPRAVAELKAAQRAWLAADGLRAMTSSLTFFPLLGQRLARAQLGNFRAGLSATCLIANTAQSRLPDTWFGSAVLGLDHRVSLPHAPGLAVLFNRDLRGAGATIIATGPVATDLPPAALGVALRQQLLVRPLTAGGDAAGLG